jgi:hypothetical protein
MHVLGESIDRATEADLDRLRAIRLARCFASFSEDDLSAKAMFVTLGV